MTTLLNGEHQDGNEEARIFRALPKLISIAAVLVALGGWYQQSQQTAEAVASIRAEVKNDYQRKDVAAEQYDRLRETLQRIEERLAATPRN